MTPLDKAKLAFPPELLLSREIERHTGKRIEPAALKAMIAGHWSRLSMLAHAVHEAAGRDIAKADTLMVLQSHSNVRQPEPSPPSPGSAA